MLTPPEVDVFVCFSNCLFVARSVIFKVNFWLEALVKVRFDCTCAVPAAAFNVAVSVPDTVAGVVFFVVPA